MNDRRRSERVPITLQVEINHPELGTFLLNTRDISDTGAFLHFGTNPRRPEVGTEVSLRLTHLADGSEPPIVHARVVRVTEEGFGIAFSAAVGTP
jgi:hypothetical protein